MRVMALGLLVFFVGACGDSVAERIDEVRRGGRQFLHATGELRGDGAPAVCSLSPRLREDPGARAILDLGQSAVPELVRLLEDEERRTLATVFLAEIGGEEAVAALLRSWRSARDDAQEKMLSRSVGGDRVELGYRYEGIDHTFYREVFMALASAGRPVTAEIAKDTAAAIAESERLLAAGAQLLSREEREEDGRRIEVRRWAAPVETAREGLRLLAMLCAPEAPAEFARALRSPVIVLKRTAVQRVVHLAQPTDEVLRALRPLLDDPDLSIDTAEQVEFLLDPAASIGLEPARRMPREAQVALVNRSRAALQDHLR